MCVCTQSSDHAHPHFWYKSLPNEEHRKPPKICRIILIRSAVIRRANKDEHQNQTTITANFNYIKNFMSNLKKNKLVNKVKIVSDKTEPKQNNFLFTRKNMG